MLDYYGVAATEKHSTRAYFCVAIVLAMLYASGCSSTAGIEATVDRSTGHKQVVFRDKALAKRIKIENLNSGVTGGLLRASVTVRNTFRNMPRPIGYLYPTYKTLEFQYKFSWFDENGFEIDPDSDAWTPVTIHGQESKTLQGVAPNPSARMFKILIRGF